LIEEKGKALFCGMDVIPSYYPVELVLPSIRKNIVSESSTAFVVAAQIPHLRALCLINAIKWKEKKINFFNQHKLSLKEMSDGKIHFLPNIESLYSILEQSN
jgi:hypothetical protein